MGRWRIAPGPLAAWAYLVGAATCVGWLLIGYALLWRVLRTARTPPAWLDELFHGACRATGVRRARLLIASPPLRPVSCGLWKPTVLLATHDCAPQNCSRLRQVLLHEAAHLRQRDAWGNTLLNLAMPVLYFHPLYWLLRSRASLAREMVADDIAASITSRAAYAADLLELARIRAGLRATPLAAVGIFRSPSHFYRRMQMLMQRNIRLDNRCSLAWRMTSGSACIIVLVAACVSIGVRPAVAQDRPRTDQARQEKPDGASDPNETPAAQDRNDEQSARQSVRSASGEEDEAKANREERASRRRIELQAKQAREQALNAERAAADGDRVRSMLEQKLKQTEDQLAQLRAQLGQAQENMKVATARAQDEMYRASTMLKEQLDANQWKGTATPDQVRGTIDQRILDLIKKQRGNFTKGGEWEDLVRRTYLDLTGRLPTPDDWNAAKEFLSAHLQMLSPDGKGAPGNAHGPSAKPESTQLNTAVGGLRPQLDLVALANSYADAVGNIAAAKEELNAAQNDPRERSAARAKLVAAEQKAGLLRAIAQAALGQAKRELDFAHRRFEAGDGSAGDAFDAETRVQILALILHTNPDDKPSAP